MNSTALSSEAESLPPGTMTGNRSLILSANGVDFAIVRDIAVRVRELPTRKSVRRETLVDEAECAGDEGVGQFEVELLDLRRQHEAFVDDRATGEGWDVEVVFALDVRNSHLVFSPTADDVKQALEVILVHAIWCSREELFNIWLRGAGFTTDGVAVHGRIAPAEDLE